MFDRVIKNRWERNDSIRRYIIVKELKSFTMLLFRIVDCNLTHFADRLLFLAASIDSFKGNDWNFFSSVFFLPYYNIRINLCQ